MIKYVPLAKEIVACNSPADHHLLNTDAFVDTPAKCKRHFLLELRDNSSLERARDCELLHFGENASVGRNIPIDGGMGAGERKGEFPGHNWIEGFYVRDFIAIWRVGEAELFECGARPDGGPRKGECAGSPVKGVSNAFINSGSKGAEFRKGASKEEECVSPGHEEG